MNIPGVMWLIPWVWVPSNWSWSKARLLQRNGNSSVRVVMFIWWLCWMSLVMIIIFSWHVNEISWPPVISWVGYISTDTNVVVIIYIWHLGYGMKSMLHIPWNEDGLCDAGLGLEALQLLGKEWNLLMVLWCESRHSQIFRSCGCWKSWWFL